MKKRWRRMDGRSRATRRIFRTFLQNPFSVESVWNAEISFWNMRTNHAHTLGDGAPCVLLGAGKRSNDTLPPVGGAQQSQVAVGGAEALLRRRRRPLGSSQHLRVLKQVGKIAGSGQVEVFSTVTAARVKVSRGDELLLKLFWCPRAQHSTCPHTLLITVPGWVNAISSLSSNSICVLKASLVLSPL